MVTSRQTALAGADFDTWLNTLNVQWTPAQIEIVRRAYELGGNPELAVADLLADLGMDHETAAAALLHQTVADGQLALLDIREQFGEAVAHLVDGVIKLDVIGELHQTSQHIGRQLESLRKMLLAMAQDLRVVLIRLAMQLHILRQLGQLAPEEQQRIARETLDVFSPLANRLGIGRIKWEMEDLALRYLEPITYKQLATALDQRRADREQYIAHAMEELRAYLRDARLRAEVSGRVKHIYSIWRKMQHKKLSFEQIFDVRAVRILVETVNDCYAALGVVHAHWNHIHQEFDDYIAHPKPNGYQSLHTAVVGSEGRNLEVQIRTFEMHRNAELGIAAHWRYKEGGHKGPGEAAAQQIAWLRQMLEYREGDTDDGDLLERFKAEAFQDRVYAITPKGTIVELPQGATPLDFAYHVHTEVGHRCRGAKVNGRIVPLTYELKNGEQVDILTTKTSGPSRDWLSPHLGYVKSNRARAKIRQWFIQQDQDKSITAGRAALEREFQRLGIRSLKLEKVAERLGFTKPDELFATIGHGALTTGQVVSKVQDLLPQAPLAGDSLPVIRKPKTSELSKGDVRIRGVGQLMTQIAHCCQPAPFEPIAGYITQGRGVTIHRQDCTNLLALANQHSERIIEVSWGETPATYPVDIMIIAHDRSGLLRDIASILANEQVNVLGANTLTDRETSIARMGLTLEITDVLQLSRMLDKISQLRNVMEAYRKS
ncbi:MAG TPA: GTP diphosphokinase [Candidatus Competibacteraceae bacterium]|nr:GTP diphosphokinase [Candidatus Competibacteraceae bacterium]MCP5132829.1 GTP diphosphokinase [Gammaproteobacteria bacterium]HPF57541.1 GTP diphosphokinase [Candidatus Competibacteraceae bacterium]HRY16938.1 GTP diphosphokinase [Candidatus Competibacteraceae bacterium]